MSTKRRSDISTILVDGMEIIAHVDPTRTFTTVAIGWDDNYGGTGTAKRNPEDDYDADVGLKLALARALRDLADNIEDGAGL